MAFLKLNGYEVNVLNATPRRRIERVGRRDRSFRGQLRDAHRSRRRSWMASTCFESFSEADAFERWLWGEGHFFDFKEGLHASTGLLPEPGYGGKLRINRFALDPFGTFSVPFVEVDDEIFLQYNAQLGADWSVSWWERDTTHGTTFHHAVKRSDGTGYYDGVEDNTVGDDGGTSAIVVNVAGGTVYFSRQVLGSPGDITRFSDMAIYPYQITARMADGLANATGNGGPLPVLLMEGDIIGDTPTFVVCEVRSSEYTQAVVDMATGLESNVKKVDFNIIEVDDKFVVR